MLIVLARVIDVTLRYNEGSTCLKRTKVDSSHARFY